MLANQLYYDFTREVEKIKNNMFLTNSNFNRDSQILTRQVLQLKESMDFHNREMEKRLNDLRKMIQSISNGQSV
jgi:hypothetical protein